VPITLATPRSHDSLEGTAMKVSILFHTHVFSEDSEELKVIGVYSTPELATEAIERYRHLPGFGESMNGFEIDTYTVGEDHWTEGFVTVSD
jgi:hypothetical protein